MYYLRFAYVISNIKSANRIRKVVIKLPDCNALLEYLAIPY